MATWTGGAGGAPCAAASKAVSTVDVMAAVSTRPMKRLRDMTELRGNEPAQPMGVSGILRKKGRRVTNVKNHHPSMCAILRHISHIPAIRLQERNAQRLEDV
ncbi:hypothetical protein OCUBac02_28850 [Bosea sp. ANAM02]|nr:hypothetical protein OCUBac02_28850 [Bosea sp. ANAM02]